MSGYRFLWVLCVSVYCLPSFASESDAELCAKHFQKTHYDLAQAACRSASIDGDVGSKYRLGQTYIAMNSVKGDQVKIDIGLKLIREAARLGDVDAQYKMGEFHQAGKLVKKDQAKACDWWALAASNNMAQGQEKLGVCFFTGRGRSKDLVKSYVYLTLAARQGSKSAAYIVARYDEQFSYDVKQLAKAEM